MVAANASATALASKLRHCSPGHRRTNWSVRLVGPTKRSIGFSSGRANGSFGVRAQRQDQEDTTTTNNTAFTSKEDVDYQWKLVVGSSLGAALIKYGSVFFPDITTPNLTLALLMIFSPMLLALLLLLYLTLNPKN